MVGGQYESVEGLFESCEVRAELDNGYGVENEEVGEPIAVCSGPREPWDQLWPEFAHLD